MGFFSRFFTIKPPDIFEDFSALGHKKVLVAVQDPHLREMWHMYLDSYSCDTIIPKNGVETLNLASSTSVDVAIVDSKLIDIGYQDLCHTIKAGCPASNLFLVKGIVTRRATDAEAAIGIRAVIDKSISSKMLAGLILEAINDQKRVGA